MTTNYHQQINNNNYASRQQRSQLLSKYRNVRFRGVPVHKHAHCVVTFVSVYLQNGEQLDHVNIKLSKHQYNKISCYHVYEGIGKTKRYYAAISHVIDHKHYVFSMPSYTITDVKNLRFSKFTTDQCSQWQNFHIKLLDYDPKTIMQLPNDGSRERQLEKDKYRRRNHYVSKKTNNN